MEEQSLRNLERPRCCSKWQSNYVFISGRWVGTSCSNTLRRVAYRALMRAEARNLAAIFGRSQYGVGRKAALESLARDMKAEIARRAEPAVAQFDCSSAFNHAGRTEVLDAIERLAPTLTPAFATILTRTTFNISNIN